MAVTAPLVVGAMRLSDIASVLEIERLSFSSPWPAYAFEHELTANRLAHYVVARREDRVVGFAGVWLMADEAHITTFGVHPEHRRRGIGRRLLLRLVDLAAQLRASRITLEVRVSNLPAQALYASFGFAVSGRRIAYYSDDGEDALVMTTPALDDAALWATFEEERARIAREDGA